MSVEKISKMFVANGYERAARNYWVKRIEMDEYVVFISTTYLKETKDYQISVSIIIGKQASTLFLEELCSSRVYSIPEDKLVEKVVEFEASTTTKTFQKAIHTIFKTMGKI